MMVKIMSNSKRIKEKVHFSVSILAGAVHIFKTLVYIVYFLQINYNNLLPFYYIKVYIKLKFL